MKILIFLLTVSSILVLPACHSQSQKDAKKTAGQIEKTLQENSPGYVAASESGTYMKAKIDGRQWSASKMLDDKEDSRRVLGENNGESIGFGVYMPTAEPGKTKKFSDTNAADLFTKDNVWGGYKGEIVITKVDDKWVEGTFHFTATSSRSDKSFEVTDGVFRVPVNGQQAQ